ncbi:carbohydrate sulfotransferase 14-like [Strongylocentrotus purpuratus]|uniref:Carbohydrate sulfotransferase n=1 Tax=Strongylocentrotus purpuratus TaxID=7668 RepID=A0A7M7NIL1_STRPU|nr:carbohydrate sulfotransferase 14-like [Strongylocentrotus purpuratus]
MDFDEVCRNKAVVTAVKLSRDSSHPLNASDNSGPMFPSIIQKYDDQTNDESEGIVVVVEDRRAVVGDHPAVVSDRPAELDEKANNTMKLHIDVLNRQKVRKSVLRKACSELFNIHPSRDRKLTKKALASMQHTLVIDKYRLLYCYVPKVGCTSWKQLFLVAYGIVDIKDRQKSMHKESNSAFKTPGQLEQTEANKKLQDYTNFLFVRNPFSRLLSAYRQKMDGRNPQDRKQCPFCHSVTQWFITTDPKYLKGRNKTQPYSFVEFVRFVIAQKTPNDHWTVQYELCHPCTVDYDFIGKYETVQEDAETFLRSATNDSSLKYPDTDPAKPITDSSSDENMVKYYRTIPNDVFKSLIAFFYRDLRLFGYSIPDAIWRPQLRLSKLQVKLKELG